MLSDCSKQTAPLSANARRGAPFLSVLSEKQALSVACGVGKNFTKEGFEGGEIAARVGGNILSALVDKGWIEMMDNDYLEAAAEALVKRTQSEAPDAK